VLSASLRCVEDFDNIELVSVFLDEVSEAAKASEVLDQVDGDAPGREQG
jgi:hypothetical protein